jgi:spore germination protein PE
MLQRLSYVDHVNVKIVSFASILQIGDSQIINKLSKALAVQREAEVFYENEGNLSEYRVFNEPISFLPINESISFVRQNINPIIKVNHIDITGISSSSMLNIGSSRHISMEARVKHIRQLQPRAESQSP